ncbi:MAG: alpha/beta hydrolase [Minicystis sp.]
MAKHLEMAIGALNGLVGDYLKRTDNGLATAMDLVHGERVLPATREAIAAAHPAASPRAVVLVHGLMSTEHVFHLESGETYATLLARDLGYTPFAVRYNSGLHISENGELLDALLERLAAAYPVPLAEIALVGHSMGGLVIRSAAHAASERDRRWLPLARRAFYLGSPHLGAPLERFGNVLTWALSRVGNVYTDLVADIINLRSSGVKDLRYGNLRHEDWQGEDADALLQNRRHPVPLLPHVRHHLIAGTLVDDPFVSMLFGDALVTIPSATGRARPEHRSPLFPREHVRILPAFDHLRLAHDPTVYEQIRAWCAEEEEIRCDAGVV